MRTIWFILSLAAVFLSSLLQAKEPVDRMALLRELEDLEFRIMDHPKEVGERAARIHASLDPEKEPQAWLRAAIVEVDAGEALGVRGPLVEKIDTFLAFARERGYKEEEVVLLCIRAAILRDGATLEITSQTYQEARQLALKLDNKLFLARVLREWGYYLHIQGSSARAFELHAEAQQVLPRKTRRDEQELYILKNSQAVMLEGTEHARRALALYEEVEAYARREKLRYFLALAALNQGQAIQAAPLPEIRDMNQALQKYQLFREMSAEIEDEVGVGMATDSIAIIQILNFNSCEIGLKLLREAAAIFERYELRNNLAENLRSQADCQAKLGNYAEVDRLVTKGLEVIPGDSENLRLELLRHKARSATARRKFEEATQTYEQYLKLLWDRFDREKKQDMAKQSIILGLKVEEEKTQALALKNQLQEEKLAAADTLRRVLVAIVSLSLLVIASMSMLVVQSRAVARSRERMKRILDTIEEGILTVDSQLKIEKGYSRYLEDLFGHHGETLEGLSVVQVLTHGSHLTRDEQSILEQSLFAMMGETDLAWSLNMGHLPRELQIEVDRKQIIALHWQALFNADGLLQGLLIVVRDITREKAMAAELQAEQRKADRVQTQLQEVLSVHPKKALQFLERYQPAMQEVQSLWTGTMSVAQAYRLLHTIKGAARTLGLRTLAGLCHDMESQLDLSKSTFHDRDRMYEIWLDCMQEWREYLRLEQHMVQNVTGIPDQSIKHSLYELGPVQVEAVRRQLEGTGLFLHRLEISDTFQQWTQAELQKLDAILLHALTNSIDHGFILPLKRGQEPHHLVQIRIEALVERGHLQVRVIDNGLGLSYQRLRELAEQRGIHATTEEELASVVFLEGATTAEQTTATSGRGVGMSVILELSQELGAKPQMRPSQSGGTELLIQWPGNTLQVLAKSS